jgi:hypothetical protein
MEKDKIGRYVSIVGAAFLILGTLVALLVMFALLPLMLVLYTLTSGILVVIAVAINVSCSFALVLVEDASTRLVAAIVAVMSSITFGGPIGVTGAIMGIIGGALTFKPRSAIELSLGCFVLYIGVGMAEFGIFGFAVESAVLFAGLLILAFGTLDLRRNLVRDGDIISILALSIFWTVYAFSNSSLYNQATKENLLLTWQTVPWIFSIILSAALQCMLVLSFFSDWLK